MRYAVFALGVALLYSNLPRIDPPVKSLLPVQRSIAHQNITTASLHPQAAVKPSDRFVF